MNVHALVLFIALIGYYVMSALAMEYAEDVILLTSFYIVCLTVLKIWQDKGVYLSLYHISAVAYFYYIAKEIWFRNPMLSEFTELQILHSVQLISIGSAIILTALACSSNAGMVDKRKEQNNGPGLYISKWLTLPIFFIYVSLMAVPAYLTLTMGRTAVYGAAFASISLFVPFLNAMGYLLPAFLHLSFKGGVFPTTLKLAMIALVFLIQIGIGNRFVILFSFFIYVSMLVDVRKLGVKNVVLPIIILSAVSLVMSQLRTASGLSVEHSDEAVSSEGLVYYMCGLMEYYSETHHSYLPVYSTFSLYFLIPRAIWSSKPELIGSWVLDTGVFAHRFSEGHSGSVSFIGPFFADFGFTYVVPLLILGYVMVRMDKYLLRHVGEYSVQGMIAASFVPLVFFGYRSFNTSVAAEIILIMIVLLVSKTNKMRINTQQV